MKELKGYIDKVTPKVIGGWAAYPGDKTSLQITIQVESKTKTVVANQFRSDIKHYNIHPTGYCGFHCNIEDIIPSNKAVVEVSARVDGKDLNKSPFTLITKGEVVKKRLAFIHIPKTAGTSINDYYKNVFGKDNILTHIESNQVVISKDILKYFPFVSGHIIYGQLKETIEKGCILAGALRNPIKHLISHLNWVRNISENPSSSFFLNHSEPIRELSLKLRSYNLTDKHNLKSFIDNIDPTALALFDNCQTRYLQSQIKSAERKIDYTDYEIALNNLNSIEILGTTENVNELIDKINIYFGLNIEGKLPVLNKREHQSILGDATETIFEVLEPLIHYDLMLYKHVMNDYSKDF